MNNLFEDLMNDAIQKYLKSTCIRYTWQVPALGGRIDFVGVRPSYEVIGIEAKISNWRYAIKQAKRCQLIVDKAYIAVPYPIAQLASKKRTLLRKSGVGLISVGKIAKVLIGASEKKLTIPDLRNYILEYTLRKQKRSVLRVCERVTAFNNTTNPSLEDIQCWQTFRENLQTEVE
jgi:hypothetical protein